MSLTPTMCESGLHTEKKPKRGNNFISVQKNLVLKEKLWLPEKTHQGKIKKEGTPTAVFAEQKISSKFQVTGEIISITKSDILYVIQVSSGNTIVKVIATEDEVANYHIGQKVLVASKAFNPIIQVLK